MKRKLIYRLASLGLAISCALVSIPAEGLSGVLTVYAEEATEPVEPMEEATETVESTEETTEIVEPIEETTETVEPLVETEEPTQEVDDVYFDAANGVSHECCGVFGYDDTTLRTGQLWR